MTNPAYEQGMGAVQQVPAQQDIHQMELYGAPADAYQVSGGGKARLAFQVVGAMVSLAVIGAGAWWGYKQTMRDLHGVPVVRALEGPMRIAPENPGGQVADHAGLAVNAVQAAGVAASPEAQLILAPEPVALTEDDLPGGELKPSEAAVAAGTGEVLARVDPDDSDLVAPSEPLPSVASLTQDLPEGDPVARALALAEAAAAGAVPLSADASSEASPETVEVAAVAVPLNPPGSGPAVPRSPRPAPRPAMVVAVQRAAATPASASIVPETVDVTSIAAGTRLVQLGAYDSPEDAKQAWSRIAGSFDGLMSDKKQVVVEASAGGRSFWRLRALGFADLAEARRFCAALLAENADCIPVVAR